MPDSDALAFASTEALITELLGRFDCGVVVALKELCADSGKHMIIIKREGHPYLAVGLLDQAQNHILAELLADSQPGNGEDL